jgi:hypothetical protein
MSQITGKPEEKLNLLTLDCKETCDEQKEDVVNDDPLVILDNRVTVSSNHYHVVAGQLGEESNVGNPFINGVLRYMFIQLSLSCMSLQVLSFFYVKYTRWRMTSTSIMYTVVLFLLLMLFYLIYITQSLRYRWGHWSVKLLILVVLSVVVPVVCVFLLEALWIDVAIQICSVLTMLLVISVMVWLPLTLLPIGYEIQMGGVVIIHLGTLLYVLLPFGISVFDGFSSLAPINFTNLHSSSKQALFVCLLSLLLLLGIIINLANTVSRGLWSNGNITRMSDIPAVAMNLYINSYCIIIQLCSSCCSCINRCTKIRFTNTN